MGSLACHISQRIELSKPVEKKDMTKNFYFVRDLKLHMIDNIRLYTFIQSQLTSILRKKVSHVTILTRSLSIFLTLSPVISEGLYFM